MKAALQWDTILFDLSGTLINYRDSVVGWEAMERLGFTAVAELLHANGHRSTVPDVDLFHSAAFQHLKTAWHDTLIGTRNLHLHDLLREAVAAQGIAPNDTLIEQAVLRYTAAISAGAQPCPGAAETLRALKAQGRNLGLISNTMRTLNALVSRRTSMLKSFPPTRARGSPRLKFSTSR
jgi:phosphoglycolate phosphatase-like HAD superfamily hydrolase